MKVNFNGTLKIIQILTGVTSLDVKQDLYSEWKTWMTQGDNSKYLPALSCVGGDPISGELFLGSTFFLENGWKIRPQEANHMLNISGNIFTRDGSSPLVQTIGSYNVTVSMSRSNLIDTVATGGGGGADADSIASAVWDKQTSQIATENSIGEVVKNINDKADVITAISAAGL